MDFKIIEDHLQTRHDLQFTNSIGNLIAYQMSWGKGGSELVHVAFDTYLVRLQRFYNKPRMRIFVVDASAAMVLGYGEGLSRKSYRPVTVVNIQPDQVPMYQHYNCSILIEDEAHVNARDLAESPDQFFSTRARTALRKSQRECAYDSYVGSVPHQVKLDAKRVIDEWKKVNGEKHFRDRKSVV